VDARDARVGVLTRSVVAIAIGGLVVLDLRLAPPADPNGGWPFARAAGARIVADWPGPFDVRQLPDFKTAEGVGFPVIVAGGEAVIATDPESAAAPLVPGTTLVIACDRLFEDVMARACGGPAEPLSPAAGGLRPRGGCRRLCGSTSRPRISIMIFRP
jgi:hypothetical protein